jgi:osmotically-inducible protein OsmY
MAEKRATLSRAGKALARSALDRRLEEQIEAHFTAQRRRGRLEVEVKGGFVLLRGFVGTYREKERLHRFVMGLRGVRAVKDLVRIRPVETLADRRVVYHVRQALDAHAGLPVGTATIQVTNGACTLRGYVRTAEERHVAEQVASHCRGVRSVINDLTVDPLDEAPDEATTRAVRSALDYCKDFALEDISVCAVDGRVMLRGTVPTLWDRALAEEVTRAQPSVRCVENHIQVLPDDRRDGHRRR